MRDDYAELMMHFGAYISAKHIAFKYAAVLLLMAMAYKIFLRAYFIYGPRAIH